MRPRTFHISHFWRPLLVQTTSMKSNWEDIRSDIHEAISHGGICVVPVAPAAVRRRRISPTTPQQRALRLAGINEYYARLRTEPEAWTEEMKERKLWDRTVRDGMEEE